MEKNNSSFNYFGLIIFILGLGLLLLTFFTAYSFISNPESLTEFSTLAPETDGDLSEVINPVLEIISYLVVAVLLWVMGSIGGRVTKHGLKTFESENKTEKVTQKTESVDETTDRTEKDESMENSKV